MHAAGFEDLVGVVGDVAFVVHLDHDVAVAPIEDPIHRVVHGAQDRGLIGQPVVLAEVEDAEDRDHPQLVGPVEDAFEPRHVVGPQRSVGGDG